MEPLSEIKENIRKIAGMRRQVVFTAKVVSVDDESCTVEVDDVKFSDVRLRSVINGEKSRLLITPKVGSYVLVCDMAGDMCNLAVLNYSEIDKIEIGDDVDIEINGGHNKGLVKIEELTKKLNELVNWCKGHTHSGSFTGTIGGEAAEGALTVPAPPIGPNEFNIEAYEDDKITH